MAADDTPRSVHLADAMRFSVDARVNEELMATDGLVVRMNCYEAGQVTPMHMHPGEDEIVYVVEGAGEIRFRDRADLPFRDGDLLRLPRDQFHSIVAGPEGRTVVIYFMKSDYASVRPDAAEEEALATRLPGERG